jgi:hypothetical protein
VSETKKLLPFSDTLRRESILKTELNIPYLSNPSFKNTCFELMYDKTPLFIRSNTGTGKTRCLLEFLKKRQEEAEYFIYICTRVNQADSIYSEMRRNGINVQHYD